MELHEALQAVRFDKRLLEWHLNRGLITQAEIDKFINALPDVSAQSMPLDFEMDGRDDDSDLN